jgi:PqqA peptide cyclase
MSALQPPLGLLAELTHRCPLRCTYCSNPLTLERRSRELDTDTWLRVFREAAQLGVLHVHLSGGEPGARRDLVELAAGAAAAGLYTNLITSGIALGEEAVALLASVGLDHVQLSLQDTHADKGDAIAGRAGAQLAKRRFARAVVAAGLPLTVNVVLHSGNIARLGEMVDEAARLGARRIELAHAQLLGWAAENRHHLIVTREQAAIAAEGAEEARRKYRRRMVVDYVTPDYHMATPKPCMNGWARQSLNVTPSGRVLPCHAAETIAELAFWDVHTHTLKEIWEHSPAFVAFRGTAWMREPCTSCSRKNIDFGGCRCQALALTGDARNTDPACILSPHNTAFRGGHLSGANIRSQQALPRGPGRELLGGTRHLSSRFSGR